MAPKLKGIGTLLKIVKYSVPECQGRFTISYRR